MNNNLPSDKLEIRPASFTDIETIREIALKIWPQTYEPIIGKEQVEYMLDKFYSTESLQKQMEMKHYFFLALLDYKPVGYASFSLLEGKIYKLQKLYILPELHGTGSGKKLLQHIETEAKNMGATKLLLNVNRKNIAKGFYEKNGFTVAKEEDIDIENGYWMNDYIMQKDLNNW